MKVLVIDTNIPTPNGVLIELKEIICPKCNENVIINLKDYKLEMKCKNNSCVYHYELENYDYDESKNFYLRENNFDFTSEDNHREMLSG